MFRQKKNETYHIHFECYFNIFFIENTGRIYQNIYRWEKVVNCIKCGFQIYFECDISHEDAWFRHVEFVHWIHREFPLVLVGRQSSPNSIDLEKRGKTKKLKQGIKVKYYLRGTRHTLQTTNKDHWSSNWTGLLYLKCSIMGALWCYAF